MEIYNEQITDLLEPSSSNLQVLVYKCDDFGYVDNKLSAECLPLEYLTLEVTGESDQCGLKDL